jgi:hypothetical protein
MTILHDNGAEETAEVTLDRPLTVLGYSIQITDAWPVIKVDQPAPQEKDYILTVAIERS